MNKKFIISILSLAIIVSAGVGGVAGFYVAKDNLTINATNNANIIKTASVANTPTDSRDQEVINVVKSASPAVVSVVVSKDIPSTYSPYYNDPFFKQFFGEDFPTPQAQNNNGPTQIGAGSGFIVSADGFIVTNKHVIIDDQAIYTVEANDGKKYTAKILAKDPVNDLAIIKIEAKNLPYLTLGDSNQLQVGQTAIAIGNALGEFNNTVSTGVVSGLLRTINAGDLGNSESEHLAGLIQTDASINPGNSGGPLLNLKGQVIGVNVAVAQDAQGIGFALPINELKNTIDSVKKDGKLIRAWLGVRYMVLTPQSAKANKLPKDYGALVIRGQQLGDSAVVPNSPADKAGIKENDIILEVEGKKLTQNNDLAVMIASKKPGDNLKLKIYSGGQEKNIVVKLEEAK